MEKNKKIFYALIIASFVVGLFPMVEFFLSQQGLSTCGEEGIGCRVVSMVTPYGTTPFFVLGATFGFAVGIATFFRMKIVVPALLCAGLVVESILMAFQINLGFFCRFCLIYACGVCTLAILYLLTTPRAFTLFAIPSVGAFMSIFLLYFSFAGASLDRSYILEQVFDDSEPAYFYVFYSHTCSHCANVLYALDKNQAQLKGTFRLGVTDGNIGRAEAAKQYEGTSIFERGLKGMAGDPKKATEETIAQCETAKRYLAKHGISETPTMIVVDGEKWTTTVHGTSNILDYLEMRFGVELER